VSDCCLTPNEQSEEFDISKNACTILVIVIDSSFVEQVEEQGIYLSKY
jgi:hypothetical protein